MTKYVTAHAKGLLAVATAVLLLVVDQTTADIIIAVLGSALAVLVPNNQAAIESIYGPTGPGP
jgi:hypothetical protein